MGVPRHPGNGEGAGCELRDGAGRLPDIIATGGDAETLFKGWELAHANRAGLDAVRYPLAYANHPIKRDT